MSTKFRERVRQAVRAIPEGRVMTYGTVAGKAGFPGAARAVGSLMKGNYDEAIPCHRVVRADGKMGGYNRGGSRQKALLLRKEGVPFISTDRVKL